MQQNAGGVDRTVRIAVGVVLLAVAAVGLAGSLSVAVGPISQTVRIAVTANVGLVALATGVARKCGINEVLGGNTAERYRPRSQAGPSVREVTSRESPPGSGAVNPPLP